MLDVIKRLHLKISDGGCGIISSENIREGAYIGSIALCASHMGKLCPDLICENKDDINALPMFMEYISSVDKLRNIDNLDISDLDVSVIWNEAIKKVQHRIGDALHKRCKLMLYNELPNGDARYGLNGFDDLSVSNKAIRFQGIANSDKCVSAFIYANPAIPHLQKRTDRPSEERA